MSSFSKEETVERMVLAVGDGCLKAVMQYSDGSVVMPFNKRWHCEPVDALSRLEDEVYEHPELFEDVRMSLLLIPSLYTIAPESLVSSDGSSAIEKILDEFDLSENKECFCEKLGDTDNNLLLFSLPSGMRGFLQRCFPTDNVSSALLPYIKNYLPVASSDKGDRMWVDITETSADVVAFRNGRLLLANTWHWKSETDLAYYLLYAWTTLELDKEAGHLYVSGVNDIRQKVITLLRKYINYVASATLSAFHKEISGNGIPLSMACELKSMS